MHLIRGILFVIVEIDSSGIKGTNGGLLYAVAVVLGTKLGNYTVDKACGSVLSVYFDTL